MTSQGSSKRSVSSHAVWSTLRQFWLLPAGFGVILLAVIPGWLLEKGSQNHLLEGNAAFFTPYGALTAWAALPAMGILTALGLFYFLFRSPALCAYFTLGIGRSRLFAIRYFLGAGILFVSLLPAMLASLTINLLFTQACWELFRTFLYLFCLSYLAMMVPFTLTAAIVTMCGTLSEAAVYTGIWLSAPHLLGWIAGTFARALLPGSAVDGYGNILDAATSSVIFHQSVFFPEYNTSLFEWSVFFGPLTFPAMDIAEKSSVGSYNGAMEWPELGWWKVVVWLLVTAAGALLAWRLFLRRKGEQTGFIGQCRGLVIATALMGGLYGCGLIWGMGLSTPLRLLLGVLVYGAVFFLIGIAGFQGIAWIKRRWPSLAVSAGGVLLIGIILATGGMGFSQRIPPVDSIEKAEIGYSGDTELMEMVWRRNADAFSVRRITYTSPEDLAVIIGLHKTMADQGRPVPNGKIAQPYKETAVSIPLDIIYTLKDGRVIRRVYDVNTLETLEQLLKLDKTEAMTAYIKERFAEFLQSENEFVLYDSYFQHEQILELEAIERTELVACLEADYQAQSLEDRYFPEKDARMILQFGSNGSATFPLTDAYSRTLDFLEKLGLATQTERPDPESVTLYSYNLTKDNMRWGIYQKYNGDGWGIALSSIEEVPPIQLSPEQTAALLPKLRSAYFASEPLYAVRMEMKDETEEYPRTVLKWLPAKDLPAGILPE